MELVASEPSACFPEPVVKSVILEGENTYIGSQRSPGCPRGWSVLSAAVIKYFHRGF